MAHPSTTVQRGNIRQGNVRFGTKEIVMFENAEALI